MHGQPIGMYARTYMYLLRDRSRSPLSKLNSIIVGRRAKSDTAHPTLPRVRWSVCCDWITLNYIRSVGIRIRKDQQRIPPLRNLGQGSEIPFLRRGGASRRKSLGLLDIDTIKRRIPSPLPLSDNRAIDRQRLCKFL